MNRFRVNERCVLIVTEGEDSALKVQIGYGECKLACNVFDCKINPNSHSPEVSREIPCLDRFDSNAGGIAVCMYQTR